MLSPCDGRRLRRRSSKHIALVMIAGLATLGATMSTVQATEPPSFSDPNIGRGGGVIDGRQSQDQFQDQFQEQSQEQFQDQNQTQRQGDNRVSVDGDDVDYFALALPNLVAASCAGSSYSVGGGGGGFGFGFGQATIDRNCQIAKAIATAHLLEGAKLVNLSTSEYRHALCQMHGMEHVCKAEEQSKKRQNPGWCELRVKRDRTASKWSDRDLSSCGLRRAHFDHDRDRWLELTHYDGREVVEQQVSHEERYTRKKVRHGHGCPTTSQQGNCPDTRAYRKKGVLVRVGEHCDYDRVVFDWPQRVGYETERDGDEITIDFDRASQIDVSRVRRDLGRFILGARTEKHEAGTKATLVLASDVKGKVWRLGHRVIVDGRKPGCG